MGTYEVTEPLANGSACMNETRSTSSTPWAENLRAKYGISAPMAPDDGRDEEQEHLTRAFGALNS